MTKINDEEKLRRAATLQGMIDGYQAKLNKILESMSISEIQKFDIQINRLRLHENFNEEKENEQAP